MQRNFRPRPQRLSIVIASILGLGVNLAPGPGASAHAAGNALPKIVSANVCADQWVMLLADDNQILALSTNADDPRLSVFAKKGRKFPRIKGRVEEIVTRNPDLVLSGAAVEARANRRLRTLGYAVFEIQDAVDFDAIEALAQRIGVALHQSERASAVVASMRATRQGLAGTAAEDRPRALVLYPRGGTFGNGSLGTQILRVAGYRNVAAERGIGPWGWIDLENILASSPDILAFNDATALRWSRAQALLSHAALRGLNERAPIIHLPSALWSCAGPWSIEAALAFRRDAAKALGSVPDPDRDPAP